MRVFRDRDSREEENQWTFGQLVPVLLLLLPVFLAGECFSGNGLFVF